MFNETHLKTPEEELVTEENALDKLARDMDEIRATLLKAEKNGSNRKL